MIEELKREIISNDNSNVAYSEKGAKMNSSTGKNLLDLSFKVPSMRTWPDSRINKSSDAAYRENRELFVRFMFYLRDVLGGIGERDTFRRMFVWFSKENPAAAEKLLRYLPAYGRWDDLVHVALNTKSAGVAAEAARVIAGQIKTDLESDNVSLLGKWLPSVNAGKKSAADARKLVSLINKTYKCSMNAAYYRKAVSKLRAKAGIVEHHIAAKTYGDINYEAVPSLANTRYSKLFLKYDEKRRREYLESVSKGEKKINSSAAFPHDIWRKVSVNDNTADEMWKALPNFITNDSRVLVVRDGSGSMLSRIPNSVATAMDVASSLCVYFAERLTGEFHNKFITFSSYPDLVELPEGTLYQKKRFLNRYDDCSNTDIEATFQLILDTAVKNQMKQEDLPDTLLIVSDMEFDSATYGDRSKKLFNNISERWSDAGYKMPKLVFWNVNSRTETIPMTQNENGVILVSGFSAAICKTVLSNETDPYKALVKALMNARYDGPAECVKEQLRQTV